MNIVLFNPFPARSHSFELQFIESCLELLRRMGHQAGIACTSDEIEAAAPDLVILPNHLVPKLTHHLTFGLLLTPPRLFESDIESRNTIRSWDRVFAIHAATRSFARDLHFPARLGAVVSDLPVYPSFPTTAQKPPNHLRLVCTATPASPWHQELFAELAVQGVDLYGPDSLHALSPKTYRGELPKNRSSAILNDYGVVLVLHEDANLRAGIPDQAVFQALAAHCLVLTEAMKMLEPFQNHGIAAIDSTASAKDAAYRIRAILQQYAADPLARQTAIASGQALFTAEYSLERTLERLVAEAQLHRPNPITQGPAITAIIRAGSRPIEMLDRAVRSLGRQSYQPIGIALVRYAEIEEFAPWLEALRATGRFLFIEEHAAPAGIRSETMWAGLRAVNTELFCMLDDDDEIFPDHLANLITLLAAHPQTGLVYTGAIRQEEDGMFHNQHPRLSGDLAVTVAERRTLQKFADFDLNQFLTPDCFLQSNAWVARRNILTPEILEDPRLEVAEDLYFYLIVASQHEIRFSGTATALWNWRSNARDNSLDSVTQSVWDDCAAQLRRRLAHVPFPLTSFGIATPRSAETSRPVLPPSWPIAPASIAGAYVQFSSKELPDALIAWRGFATPDPWGRWTVGSEAAVTFWHPPPRHFTLAVQGYVFDSNADRPVTVKIGSATAKLLMPATWSDQFHEVVLENPDGANTIIFQIPNPQTPFEFLNGKSLDKRPLGIAMMRLLITPTPPKPRRLAAKMKKFFF